MATNIILITVEPPNNGHGGDEHFVHCLEVVLFGGCPFVGGSAIKYHNNYYFPVKPHEYYRSWMSILSTVLSITKYVVTK